ncbi:hypothetical protein SASPL_125622 [Salvia splendens]|uniref:Uncharacterized protein n=1 Tax=Salvia splendens TaxID=180675 RepID=A0A8X8XHG3_SALSN|nr:uncharacterized protein LOC121746582 [Salvia splendens]KAG6412927.1 hypothetical protein SASPL_125622 [Salvia splendens]
MEEVVRKRFREDLDEAESDIDSPAVKRLREDLLDGVDDDSDFSTSTQDLDSFMKSFEEEITASPASGLIAGAANSGVIDLATHPGDSQQDLGYLLEASDDELGIPPPTASPVNELSTELVTVESDSSELRDEFWEAPGYDTFGFGFGQVENSNGDYVALDGLFDYSDMGFGSGDVSWRPETLPAQ